MGAIQIINRAAEDCRLIENKQVRKQKADLLQSGMDAVKHVNVGGVKGRSVGATGAAYARWVKSLKSAKKAAERKTNGEDLNEDDNESLKKHKDQVSLPR